MNYTLKQWDRLLVYLDHGDMTPDNNLAENVIRPFVIGRNYFSKEHPKGLRPVPACIGLSKRQKQTTLEPYKYLRYLFEKLPLVSSEEEELRILLPMYLRPEDLALGVVATRV